MDYSPPGSSVWVLQARILESVAMSSSKGSSWPRDRTYISHGSCIAGRFFTAESPGNSYPPLSICCCSSSSVMSDSLSPHGLQKARLPCLSLTPRVCANSCPSSWWCSPTISSSVIPFSSCLQSFPASRSFPIELGLCIRWPKNWGFSISPSNEYSGLIYFRIHWFDLLAVQETFKNLLYYQSSKHQLFGAQPNSHPYMTAGKTIALTIQTFFSNVMSILFNTLQDIPYPWGNTFQDPPVNAWSYKYYWTLYILCFSCTN